MENILEDFKIHLLETGEVFSNLTIESYLGNIKQLLLWLEENQKTINDLDRIVMMKYIDYLKNEGYKANTFNTKVNSITSFNNYLKTKGIIEKDIVFGKDKIQLSANKDVEVYTDQEMELIEAYIEDDKVNSRDSLVIKMLKELGLRVSELTNIRLEYLDIVGLQIEIHGKNNKRRILPMKMDLADDIRNYISNDRKNNKHSNSPYLLISERSPKLHRNTVLDIVKRMARELDMENVYNHKFRHSLATNMANRNVPIHLVQAMLGHVQVQTTIDYYISIDKDQLKSIMENM